MGTRLYRIICLKRSEKEMLPMAGKVYWMPNRAGYTEEKAKAGLYTGDDLEDCAGKLGDWVAEPVEASLRFGSYRA